MFDKLQELFTLNLGGTSRMVGRIPGGTKLDVEYLPAQSTVITTSPSSPFKGGEIASGQDWITVSELGVADFSGRLTLKFDKTLVGVHINGRADLATASHPAGEQWDLKPANAYQLWQNGFPDGAVLKLTAGMTFEVAEGAVTDFSQLERALFLGVATVTFSYARFSPIKSSVVRVNRVVLK